MLRTNRTLLTLALLATTGLVAAQPAFGPRGPVPFASVDTDGDGYVTSQEFQQHRAERMPARAAQGRLLRNAGQAPVFTAWDSDADGRLSRDELAAGQQARLQTRWQQPMGPGAGGRPCWRN